MRKRIISLLLVFCMVFSLLPTSALAAETTQQTAAAEANENPFKDVKETDWCYDAVQYARANGFFNGTSATSFSPNGSMTRGMFVTVLGRMAGVDTTAYEGESAFQDVPANMYYAPYVAWAAKYGITGGTGGGNFSPNARITRQQMAAFFVRYFEAFDVNYETGADITTVPADLDKVADYAKDAVLKLWKQGLLNGDGKSFNPNSNATRAQAATLCMRTDKAVETWYKEPGVPSDRVSVDPTVPQEPQKPDETKKPGSSGSSSGGSSDSGTTTTYYEVRFAMGTGENTDGVSLPETKTYPAGTKITLLPTPYKQDSVFLGWYYDASMNDAVGSTDTVTRNMTLYAKMGEVTPVSAQETPNYMTVIVPENKVSSYTFAISNYADGCVEYFEQVSNLNSNVVYSVESGTVSTEYQAGQTYSIKLQDDSSAVFVVGGQEQPTSIRVLNIITEKDEVQNLTLDAGIKYLPYTSVGNMTGTALDGLFTVSTSTLSTTQNKNEGTFTYTGDDLDVGDTVAIYEGTQPNLRKAVGQNVTSNDGAVAYVKIKSVSGDIYSYETADTEEVLFTPDVLPISTEADTDNNPTNNSITVPADVLDFSDDKYAEMGLDSQTTVDVGDFIAFYSGSLGGNAKMSGYARITEVSEQGENYVITYAAASENDVMAAMDIYDSRNQEIKLTDEEKRQIEHNVEQQAIESGFVEEAAEYLTALALETDGFRELSDDLDMDLSSYSITFADGTPVDPETMDLMAASATITEQNVDAQVILGTLSHFGDGTGIRVELVMTFQVEVGSGDNKLVIDLEAIFEQEVMLTINVSGGAIWKWKWIFPYIYDYQMNANLDVGTYTGIGITATAKTQGADDEDEGFDWEMSTGNAAGDKIISIGKQIKDLMDEKDKLMDQFTVPTVNGNGEETESAGTLTNGGLAEKYAAMMENAQESWIDIVRVEIFSSEGNVDPFHILCYGISADFVVQANLYVTLGMTFEYGVAKRYNFSLMLFHKKSTNETIDLEEAHYQFDFYVMGTVGVRAGVEFEIAMGLFSLKLDSIGITAEVGAYAQLWGYFYYSLSWTESGGKDSTCSGAMLIEIGLYMEIAFKAQLFSSDKLTYQPTLYENEWPLLTIGEAENIYDFAYEDDDKMLSMRVQSAKSVALSSDLFMMNYMDMKSGELYGSDSEDDNPAGNFDDESESHFIIELSNPKFEYNADGNIVTVDPGDSTMETCEITITWKQGTLAFSARPIQRTLTITWSDPANARYISFNSMGGSTVDMLSTRVGAEISAPAAPTKVGYDFGGWYTDRNCNTEFSFPSTMPDYQELYGEKGVTVYAKWIPRTDTKYTVEHYQEQLNGTYKLIETNSSEGTTDADTAATAKTYDGFTAKSITQKKIAPNGSTVVKVYYDRNTCTVRFTYGSFAQDNAPLTYKAKYGAALYAPTLALGGYTFLGYNGLTTDANGSFTVTEDVDYAANWEARTDTPYRVEHYVQRANGSGYVLPGDEAVQSLTGTTGSTVDVSQIPKLDDAGLTYESATVNGEAITGGNVGTATIAADGSTVVKLYYTRNSFNLILMDGETQLGSTSAVYGSVLTMPNVPVKQGYAFAGWYTNAGCTDDCAFTFGTATMPAEDLTLYAKWAPKGDTRYTVEHWQQNVGNDEYTKVETDDLTGSTGAATAAEAKNYDGFTAKAFTQGTITADGNAVVKIYYDRNTYFVTFDSNGGSDVAPLNDIRYDATITKPDDPTKTGYIFGGWYKDAALSSAWTFSSDVVTGETTLYAKWNGADGTAYTVQHYQQNVTGEGYTLADTENKSGTTGAATTVEAKSYEGFTPQSITQETIAADGSTVVKLYYTRNRYTLTFKPENGGADIVTNDVYFGAAISAPTEEPTKTGYTFSGWGTVAATMPAGDTTYTAQWTANRYTIAFDSNSGKLPNGITVSGSMGSQAFTYGTAQALTNNAYTLPANSGYTFVGWAKNADADAADYTDGQSVSDLTAEQDGTVTLYAVWEQGDSVTYTVEHYQMNLDGNGYTLVSDGTQTLSGIAGTLTAAQANTYTGFTPQSITQQTIAADGNTVVKLYYTRNQYGVTVKNDASDTGTTTQYYYGAAVTAPDTPSKVGHTFTGWSNGTETISAGSTFTMGTSAVTLTAQWTVNQYTITFDTDGGSEIASITKNFDESVATVTAPTKTGYTFAGWTDTNGDPASVPETMPAGDLTLKAAWTINRYTITFYTNGGSEIASIMQEYGTPITAPADPTKTGYTFNGWNKEIPETMPAENMTITAAWTPNTYTVTFAVNAGDALAEGEAAKEMTYDSTYGDLPTPTRTGYTFAGWFTAETGGTQVTNETQVKITEDQTLYAHWSPVVYTITFNAAGGSCTDTTRDVAYGNTCGTLPIPTRSGYTFDGWFTDATGGTQVTEDTTITSSQTLCAHWTVAAYTITYELNGGTNAEGNLSNYTVGDTFTLQAPSKAGYTFAGWTGSNGDTPEQSVTIAQGTTGDLTYTANWKQNTCTIQFFGYKGDGSVTDVLYTITGVSCGSTPTIPTTDIRNIAETKYPTYYFDFTTWYTDAACTVEWDGTVSADTASGSVISLYCKGGSNIVTSLVELLAAVEKAPTDGTLRVINVGANITFEDANGSSSIPVRLAAGNNILIQSLGDTKFTLTSLPDQSSYMFQPGFGYREEQGARPSLTLKNLNLVNKYITIVDNSRCTVKLENCELTGSQASAGAAVCNANGGTVILTNCTISNNTTNEGGAIYNNSNSTIQLTDCTLSGNTASRTSGESNGGAIFNNGGTITLTGCTLSGNTAQKTGGAIYNNGGTITLEGCELSNNGTAQTVGGGAICNNGGTTGLTNCTLTENSALSGGAIYCPSGEVTLTSCTLNKEDVYSAGEGTVTIDGVTVASTESTETDGEG